MASYKDATVISLSLVASNKTALPVGSKSTTTTNSTAQVSGDI
ncbi:MAG TPA: hypothetical protein VE619_10025 [Nitrososphaeraceae archaeon]|nr:hypothetical protein [Nitrososphaeraceae archaeon]